LKQEPQVLAQFDRDLAVPASAGIVVALVAARKACVLARALRHEQ